MVWCVKNVIPIWLIRIGDCMIIIMGKNKKEINNVRKIYFAEDGKLDVCFSDGRESIVINPTEIYEIRED